MKKILTLGLTLLIAASGCKSENKNGSTPVNSTPTLTPFQTFWNDLSDSSYVVYAIANEFFGTILEEVDAKVEAGNYQTEYFVDNFNTFMLYDFFYDFRSEITAENSFYAMYYAPELQEYSFLVELSYGSAYADAVEGWFELLYDVMDTDYMVTKSLYNTSMVAGIETRFFNPTMELIEDVEGITFTAGELYIAGNTGIQVATDISMVDFLAAFDAIPIFPFTMDQLLAYLADTTTSATRYEKLTYCLGEGIAYLLGKNFANSHHAPNFILSQLDVIADYFVYDDLYLLQLSQSDYAYVISLNIPLSGGNNTNLSVLFELGDMEIGNNFYYISEEIASLLEDIRFNSLNDAMKQRITDVFTDLKIAINAISRYETFYEVWEVAMEDGYIQPYMLDHLMYSYFISETVSDAYEAAFDGTVDEATTVASSNPDALVIDIVNARLENFLEVLASELLPFNSTTPESFIANLNQFTFEGFEIVSLLDSYQIDLIYTHLGVEYIFRIVDSGLFDYYYKNMITTIVNTYGATLASTYITSEEMQNVMSNYLYYYMMMFSTALMEENYGMGLFYNDDTPVTNAALDALFAS